MESKARKAVTEKATTVLDMDRRPVGWYTEPEYEPLWEGSERRELFVGKMNLACGMQELKC